MTAIWKGSSVLRYHAISRNETRLLALTSLTPAEFVSLVPAFERCFLERMRKYTIDGLPRLNRRYTAYKNSPLPTIEDKLLFILVHMKQNLTQEIQGELFEMIQSDANKWLQLLRPLLHHALQQLDAIPDRLATIVAEKDVSSQDSAPLFIMTGRSVPSNAP
jgi:Helix-turn-helix of DDE superfamily endonuclease